jgi:hypothetical protein
MKDVYGGNDYNSKHSDHHPGAFVYWRAGTYGIDAYVEDCPSECRVPWSNRRPLVWLAYPGETPEINFNLAGHGDAYIPFTGAFLTCTWTGLISTIMAIHAARLLR